MVDVLYLSILFLSPGILLYSFFIRKNYIFLIPSLSILIWSFSSTILPLNLLISNSFLSYILIFIGLFVSVKLKNINIIFLNIGLMLILEILNNNFGILNIVSTTSESFIAGGENRDLKFSNINISAIQVASLKFFTENYLVLTIPQLLGISLFFQNIYLIISFKKLRFYISLLPFVVFFIFCILLEITTIRTHFFASQILCFLIIITFQTKKDEALNFIVPIFLILFFASRLENYIFYTPIIFVLIYQYLKEIDINPLNLCIASVVPIFINYFGYLSGEDVRSNIYLNLLIALTLGTFIFFDKSQFVQKILRYQYLLSILFIIALVILQYVQFGQKALNSWLFIITHLLDTHYGWVIASLYFLISITYLINLSKSDFEKTIYKHICLVFLLIFATAPLHHSIYGGELWNMGEIELAIYNPYDESQTRAFLQLVLTIAPLTMMINIKKIKD